MRCHSNAKQDHHLTKATFSWKLSSSMCSDKSLLPEDVKNRAGVLLRKYICHFQREYVRAAVSVGSGVRREMQ